MTNTFNVSVVIALFNREKLVGLTLDSLKSEHHPGVNIEIIVVDDGSTDNSYEYVRNNYPELKLLLNNKKGAPAARNLGLQNAQHEFVLFLDSDDLVADNFFYDKINYLKNNKEVSGVYGPWIRFESDLLPSPDNYIKAYKEYPLIEIPQWKQSLIYLLEGWFIPLHAILWRKEILISVEGFDEALTINQDVDLMFRILMKEFGISGGAYPTAYIRDHSSGVRVGSINTEKKKQSVFSVRMKFYNELLKNGKYLDKEIANGFAKYCYSFWMSELDDPSIGNKFLELSKKANPEFVPKSGRFFNLMVKILGAERAVKIRHSIRKLISQK